MDVPREPASPQARPPLVPGPSRPRPPGDPCPSDLPPPPASVGPDATDRGRRPPAGASRRVLVVDDHRTFSELLSRALDDEPDLDCVGRASDCEEALRAVQQLAPDVVLMDLNLPRVDGIATTEKVLALRPDTVVIILTAHANVLDAHRAAAAGVAGFLTKDGSLAEIMAALRAGGCEGMHRAEGLGARPPLAFLAPRAPLACELTARELEVLGLLARGQDARAIARELGVSPYTSRDHVKRVLAKLGVHSQLEAVVVGARTGLIRLTE